MSNSEPTYMEAVAHGKRDCREYYQKLHNGEIKGDAAHIPLCQYLRPESVFDTCNAWHGWHAGWNIQFLSYEHRGNFGD